MYARALPTSLSLFRSLLSLLLLYHYRRLMSLDLDWDALDAELTQSVISFLSSTFQTAPRPSFLGEIDVVAFSFGDTRPEVELMDLRDIDKVFLETDEEEELEPPPLPLPQAPPLPSPHRPTTMGERGFGRGEGYSSSAGRAGSHQREEDGRSETSHQAYPALRRPIPDLRPSSALFSPGLNRSYLSAHTPPRDQFDDSHESTMSPSPSINSFGSNPPPPTSSSAPSFQMHLRLTYSGNLTIGLATSLLINYPAPRFMSLPLKLSVTSLAFTGTMLVAFEGDRRRVHLSIVDPTHGAGGLGGATPGARLLTGAVVESEVGQADKHVLKNVGKVEKFVLDVARSTLESELVFPYV